MVPYIELMDHIEEQGEGPLFQEANQEYLRQARDDLIEMITEGLETNPMVQRLIDPRNYFTYDIEISEVSRPEAPPISFARQVTKGSGGEQYLPYLMLVLASYRRAYGKNDTLSRRRRQPSMGLVLMDEAFKNLNAEAMRDCLKAFHQMEMQGLISMTTSNIGEVVDMFDSVLSVRKEVIETDEGRSVEINQTVLAARDGELIQAHLKEHELA